MNIFRLDDDPTIAAKWHYYGHSKMILETAQMMSTAVNILLELPKGVAAEGAYKSTHVNHGSNVWVRTSVANFEWVGYLGLALDEERVCRGFKPHKSAHVIKFLMDQYMDLLPDIGGTEFYLAMPDICRRQDPVEAYRIFYNLKPYLMKVDAKLSKTTKQPSWMTKK